MARLQSGGSVLTLRSGLQSEELGYPQNIPRLAFPIPFPETFDPILQLGPNGQYGGSMQEPGLRFADDGDDKIETIVYPEAKSAAMLSQALGQPTGHPSAREALNAAIVAHARSIVSTPWRDGSRFAALSLAYT